ncbi:Ig-like domain-containing protein [Neisseriaceae bacterium ESL0693]|nr:Ig-like domain-containing protein [Neisseriaceae bacterium ESL0693]
MSFYKRRLALATPCQKKPPQGGKFRQKCSVILLTLSLLFNHAYATGIDTNLSGDDKVAGPFPIGFDFNYYGNAFNQFYVSTNGLIQFNNPTNAYNNVALPYANDTLYVFWDDLRTDVANQPKGLIQYEMQGEAPNRKLIIQWTNQYFYGSNLPMGTFEAILSEGSNQIKYQYRYLSDARSRGNSATIGIQGSKNNYVQIGANKPDMIQAEEAIVFTPNSDFSQYSAATQAGYDFIDISGLTVQTPQAAQRYSNQALRWSWPKVNGLNSYEIEIQNTERQVVHREVLGNVDQFTYSEGLQNGQSYRARIRGSINQGGTWEMWSDLSAVSTIDTVKPTAKLTQFSRLNRHSARIEFNSMDNLSGVASGRVQISDQADFTNILTDQAIDVMRERVQIDDLPATGALYARISVTDKAGNQSDYSEPLALSIVPPVLTYPVNQARIKTAAITVKGMAEPEQQVQLYLNNQPIGTPVVVNAEGLFSQDITLPREGHYQISAMQQGESGQSPLSQTVGFDFALPAPSAVITAPLDKQVISASTDIQVDAADEEGIARVAIYVDNQPVADLTEPPYQFPWALTPEDNGSHTISAKVTNTSGKITTATRSVTVKITPPAPPPTPYTGNVVSVSPELSYGEQPIVISGQAVSRTDEAVVANTPLTLVLTVNGFERRINLATDEQGRFSYTFKPQQSDSGVYQLAVIHPDELTISPQASFSINRIGFNVQRYQLKMPANIATTATVNASASTNTKNLRWLLKADQQPDGVLPQGIHITTEPINLKAGETKASRIEITADDSAPESGSFYLVALTDDSADLIRGRLQVNYQLAQALPTLNVAPAYIQTGLSQAGQGNATLELTNNGIVDAKNIRLKLLDEHNQPAPNWLFIASDKEVDTLAVNQKLAIQLMMQPPASLTEGIYHFNLNIAADQVSSANIPVTVSVTRNAKGSVQFDIADIYTATLDAQGQPIKGVKNAIIKLQNENVLTEQYTLQSDDQGLATLETLPAGTYRYRVSAPEHQDVSGRLVIQPGVTARQHIFLEYNAVNVEFGVTETSIQDVYDIALNATFNTQVPAPVVLVEPLSINLGNMQANEVKTGQLTVTNYGLVQANHVSVNLPKSDDKFKYEFFGDVPDVLLPSEQKVISYRVTALEPDSAADTQPTTKTTPKIVKSTKDGCTTYYAVYTEQHDSECANGDTSTGSSKGYFYQYVGGNCSSNGGGIGGSGSSSAGGLGGGIGGGGSALIPSGIPLTSGCSPDAPCNSGGGSSGAH